MFSIPPELARKMGIEPRVPCLKVAVHDEHLRRLERIETEDYSGVVKKTREILAEQGFGATDAYLARGIYALKQYYAVALLDPANAHAISAEIDPFWHAHILHSKQYMDFCGETVGEYMHHVPLDRDDPAQMQEIRRLYLFTIRQLKKLFTVVDPEMWTEQPTDVQLICWHKGNQDLYPEVQEIRLFEPEPDGRAVVLS